MARIGNPLLYMNSVSKKDEGNAEPLLKILVRQYPWENMAHRTNFSWLGLTNVYRLFKIYCLLIIYRLFAYNIQNSSTADRIIAKEISSKSRCNFIKMYAVLNAIKQRDHTFYRYLKTLHHDCTSKSTIWKKKMLWCIDDLHHNNTIQSMATIDHVKNKLCTCNRNHCWIWRCSVHNISGSWEFAQTAI